MIWHRYLGFRFTPIFIIIAILFCFNGCSGANAPSEKQGKEKMNQLIEAYYSDYVNLKSFNKTNGKVREGLSGKSYAMDFQAELEVKKNCYTNGISNWSASNDMWNTDSSSKNYLKNVFSDVQYPFSGRKFYKKGETIIVTGNFVFENTEKGWKCIGVEFNR